MFILFPFIDNANAVFARIRRCTIAIRIDAKIPSRISCVVSMVPSLSPVSRNLGSRVVEIVQTRRERVRLEKIDGDLEIFDTLLTAIKLSPVCHGDRATFSNNVYSHL